MNICLLLLFLTLLLLFGVVVNVIKCWPMISYYYILWWSSDCLIFLACAVVTPVLQSSLCQIKLLRAAAILSRNRVREGGWGFSFLYWCISEVPQGNPVACPPPPPAWVLVGRQRQQPAPAGGPAATAADVAAAAAAQPLTSHCAKLERRPSLPRAIIWTDSD